MLRRIMYTLGVITLAGFNASAVWINEFHYDNASGDVGESVEIAGEAGTDLSGWSIVFYDGSDQQVYNSSGTLSLVGVIPNESGSGYGAISFLKSNIQNGAPDGFALVNGGGIVIEFLSYEGAFTAVGGPADGITSTDVGVSEPGSSSVGQSLQLTGDFASGFSWAGPVAESPDFLNAGQTFPQIDTTGPGTGSNSVPDGGLSWAMLAVGVGLLSLCRPRVRAI